MSESGARNDYEIKGTWLWWLHREKGGLKCKPESSV